MKQKPEKFDNLDRDLVIKEIQERCGVKLKKVRGGFKWLRDESGRNWWVLDGIDTWHGIPEEMMEDERRTQVEGVLVIAYKKLTSIDVFKGPLGPLVSASNGLPGATQPGSQYHFNVKPSRTRMRCIEVPKVVLFRGLPSARLRFGPRGRWTAHAALCHQSASVHFVTSVEPLWLLPTGALAVGRDSHPLGKSAFPWHTPN